MDRGPAGPTGDARHLARRLRPRHVLRAPAQGGVLDGLTWTFMVHDRSSRFRKEAALLISGPVAGLTTRHAKGRGIGGRAASKPAEDGVRLPAPLRVRRADLPQWLGSSRPNSTLTTEEIASNGIDDCALPPRSRIRSLSAGRRRGTAPGRNPGAFGTAGSTPAPRTHGPNARVAVHLPCKEDEDGSSPSGSTALAERPSTTGVAGQRFRRTWRNWDAPASEAGGPGP